MFLEGSIRHTAIISLGGANVTNDIAIGLRTPIDKAEQIKLQHGCALASLVPAEQTVMVAGVGGRVDREISRHVLASMIEPRMEEIFALANKEVKKNHFAELLGGGVVLTGGTSLMPGIVELAEQVFEMPVRLGVPQGLGGLSANVADPRFATGVGLVLHAAQARRASPAAPATGSARRARVSTSAAGSASCSRSGVSPPPGDAGGRSAGARRGNGTGRGASCSSWRSTVSPPRSSR